MAHTLTLRPQTDLVRPVTWVPTGFASAHAALADGSLSSPNDATYVQNPFDYQGMLLSLDDPVAADYLANDVAITGVRARVRGKRGGTTNSLRLQFQHSTRVEKGYDDWAFGTGFGNWNGWWRTSDPYGNAWTKGIIQYLGVVLYVNYALDLTVSELEVQVQYVLPPTTDVAGPSGTVATANPAITWTRTHDEGRSQSQYQVRVFDQAVYQRGDFDPDKSQPIAAYSGKRPGSTLSWTVEQTLANGTSYKAAVRTAITVNGVTVWSPWDVGAAFTVQFDAPAAPAMTVEGQPDSGRVRIDVQGLDNLLTTHEADGERESGTDTWAKVTSTMNVTLATAQAERGTHSIALAKTTSTGDMTAGPTNLVLVRAGEVLSASVRFRCAGTARSAKVTLTAYDALGVIVGSAVDGATVAGSTSGWTTAKLDGFTVPAGASHVGLTVTVLASTTSDTTYLDSALLVRGATAPAWTRGGLWTRNLLSADDSDLESSVGAWFAGNANTTVARSTTVGGQHGSAALRLTAGTGLSGVLAKSFLYPVLSGASYLAMGYGRAGSGSANGAVGMEFFDADLNSLGVFMGGTGSVATGAWTFLVNAADAPAGAAWAQVLFSVDGALSNGSLWYGDAFSLARFQESAFSFLWSRGQDSLVSTWLTVEASDDGGVTWEAIRDGAVIVPDVLQKATVYDYEVPPNVARRYRARTEATDPFVAAAPSKITSANTATQVAAIPTTRWWLKSTTDPDLSMGFSADLLVRKGSVSRSMDERAGRFDGIGARYPVWISDAVGGNDGSLTCRVYGNEAWAAFLALIEDGGTLLLVDPIEQAQFYVKLTGRKWNEGVTGAGPVRDVSLDYIEVAKP